MYALLSVYKCISNSGYGPCSTQNALNRTNDTCVEALVSVRRDGSGGTEVSVKITCEEEENIWFEIGAYGVVAVSMLTSEIKKRRREEKK